MFLFVDLAAALSAPSALANRQPSPPPPPPPPPPPLTPLTPPLTPPPPPLPPSTWPPAFCSFLEDTNSKLAQHELWIDSTDEELDNASEGLEKYLMNKMYKACFQPVASDDALRDQALADRLSLLSFIEAKHLDIPAVLCILDLGLILTISHTFSSATPPRKRRAPFCRKPCCS